MLDLSDHSNAGVSLIVWSGTRRCDVKKQIGERAPVAPFKLLQENCWQSSLRGCHLSLTSSAQSSEHNFIILGKAEDFRTSWLSNRGTNFTALLITRQNSGQSNRSFALAVTLPQSVSSPLSENTIPASYHQLIVPILSNISVPWEDW